MRRALPVLALTALLAGCGGKSKPAEASRLTQKQFVSQANRVCIASDRRIFRIGNLSADPSGWRKTSASAKTALAQMRALRPPAAKQQGFDRLLRLGTQLQREIALVAKALVEHDLPKARAAQTRATRVDTQIKLQARSLGLTFCEQLLTNWPA